jgi:hypothetical protein
MNPSSRGYLVHEHPDQTSEGFGSHARGVLFPLLHIALINHLEPIFSEHNYSGNTAREYSNLDVHSFLNIQKEIPKSAATTTEQQQQNNYKEITINTWTDPIVGSACGDGNVLVSLIQDYLQQQEEEQNTNGPIIIRLVGTLRYMNPSKEVYNWLQERSLAWNSSSNTNSNSQETGNHDNADNKDRRLRIAAHVRVPEEFTPQSWKDENNIWKLMDALSALQANGLNLDGDGDDADDDGDCDIAVYTEERFSVDDEKLLLERFRNIRIFRGTNQTLLADVQALASADILIPSSSHLSAIAGYLSHGLLVLSHSSRWDYFAHHQELGCRMVEVAAGADGSKRIIGPPAAFEGGDQEEERLLVQQHEQWWQDEERGGESSRGGNQHVDY